MFWSLLCLIFAPAVEPAGVPDADAVLAGVLLATPPAVTEPEPEPDHWPTLRTALRQVAVERELMSPGEESYLFANRSEFNADLDILRGRAVFLSGAPPLRDADRFPDKYQAVERLRFNRAFRRSLEDRQTWELDRAESLTEMIRETDQLYHVWDLARDARCEWAPVAMRRTALAQLRDLIGEDAYARGELPSNVPTWRLAEGR